MSKQEWTQEPWRYSFGEEGVYQYDDWGSIRGADDMLVTRCNTGAVCYERELDIHRKNKTDPTEPNATRIVDCVNALTGIDSPAEYISSLRQENERLRSALGRLVEVAKAYGIFMAGVTPLNVLRSEDMQSEHKSFADGIQSARQALTKEG